MCICLAAASTAMINSCALLCFPTQISAVHCYTNHSVFAEAQLQKEVLQEKARATGLEVQVRALCLELAHARENAGILLALQKFVRANASICHVVWQESCAALYAYDRPPLHVLTKSSAACATLVAGIWHDS